MFKGIFSSFLRKILAFILNAKKTFYSNFVAHSLLYLIMGLALVFLLFWNRLRLRLPRDVPIEITPEILKLFFQALPIIVFFELIIHIYLQIKQKYFLNKKPLNFVVRLREIISNFSEDLKKKETKVYQSLVRIVFKLKLGDILLSLFCWLVNGGPITEDNYKECEDGYFPISATKRFKILVKVHQFNVVIFLIPMLIGIIEMSFFNKLNFFYTALLILLVPIIWNAFIYFVDDYCAYLLGMYNIKFARQIDGGYEIVDSNTAENIENLYYHEGKGIPWFTNPEEGITLTFTTLFAHHRSFLHVCVISFDHTDDFAANKFFFYKCYFDLHTLANDLRAYYKFAKKKTLLISLSLRIIFLIFIFWDLQGFTLVIENLFK
jgi:hypothetical protein